MSPICYTCIYIYIYTYMYVSHIYTYRHTWHVNTHHTCLLTCLLVLAACPTTAATNSCFPIASTQQARPCFESQDRSPAGTAYVCVRVCLCVSANCVLFVCVGGVCVCVCMCAWFQPQDRSLAGCALSRTHCRFSENERAAFRISQGLCAKRKEKEHSTETQCNNILQHSAQYTLKV